MGKAWRLGHVFPEGDVDIGDAVNALWYHKEREARQSGGDGDDGARAGAGAGVGAGAGAGNRGGGDGVTSPMSDGGGALSPTTVDTTGTDDDMEEFGFRTDYD